MEDLYRKGRLKDLSSLTRQKRDYATALALRGRTDEAIAYLDEVMDFCEVESDIAGVVNTLNRRGYLLMEMARMEEALRDFEQAVEIRRRLMIQGGDSSLSVELAAALHSKAECYARMGQFEEALRLYNEGKTLIEHCTEGAAASWVKEILSELEALRTRCEQGICSLR